MTSAAFFALAGLALAQPEPSAAEAMHLGRSLADWTAALGNHLPQVRRDTVDLLKGGAPGVDRLIPAIAARLRDTDPEVRRVTVHTLLALALKLPDAWPPLIEALKSEDPKVRSEVLRGLLAVRGRPESGVTGHRPPLPQLPVDVTARVLELLHREQVAEPRGLGVRLVAELCPRGGEARSTSEAQARAALLHGLSDPAPGVRSDALKGLACWEGKGSIPWLERACLDGDDAVRHAALILLVGLDPKSAWATLPQLADALRNSEPDVRVPLLEAMRQRIASSRADPPRELASDLTTVLAALEVALRDPDRDVRNAALGVARSLGAASQPLVATLGELLRDTDRYVQFHAAEALAATDGAAARALLIDAVLNNPSEREATCAAVRGGPAHSEIVAQLGERLRQTPSPLVVEALAESLRFLAPSGTRVALPVLREKLRASDAEQRRAALEALRSFGAAAAAAVPDIAASLSDSEWTIRSAAAKVLGRLGVQAEAAIPALEAACNDADEHVRKAAEDALVLVLRGDAAAVPRLVLQLEGGDGPSRLLAARALGRIGPPAAPAVPGLVRTLAAVDRELAGAAIGALALIGAAALPAAPALVELMLHGDQAERMRSAGALRSIASSARHVPGEFVAAAGTQDPEMRRFVLSQLKDLAGFLPDDPVLGRALDSGDPETRLLAALCLPRSERYGDAAIAVLVAALETAPIPAARPRARSLEIQQQWDRAREEQARQRRDILETLRWAGVARPTVVAAFGQLLTHDAPEIKLAALASLTAAEKASTPVLTRIVALLGPGEPEVRRAATCAIARIGGDPEIVRPALEPILDDDDEMIRACALQGLGGIADWPGGHRDDVRRALKDPSPGVRAQAVACLVRGDASTAMSVIGDLKVLAENDPSLSVRGGAGELLKRLCGEGGAGCPTP